MEAWSMAEMGWSQMTRKRARRLDLGAAGAWWLDLGTAGAGRLDLRTSGRRTLRWLRPVTGSRHPILRDCQRRK